MPIADAVDGETGAYLGVAAYCLVPGCAFRELCPDEASAETLSAMHVEHHVAADRNAGAAARQVLGPTLAEQLARARRPVVIDDPRRLV